ncbi:hypothetical protein ACLKA7_005484, partial [Drosophila subpalustris]
AHRDGRGRGGAQFPANRGRQHQPPRRGGHHASASAGRQNARNAAARRWRLVSAVKERFWASWSRDYLLGLQQKHRLTREERNLEVDAVVLIHNVDNVPSQNWLLGVVTDVAIP